VSINSSIHKPSYEEKRSDGFSMQISNTDVFKKKNSESFQTRNSLVSAGLSMIEGPRPSGSKDQIESPGDTVMSKSRNTHSDHKREKQKILERLEELERIQKFNEEKLFRELEQMDKKHVITTPNKKSIKDDVQRSNKKVMNYEDKIKEL
jgi:hypothetical protein